jgi:arylsulfatase A-like enzyme
VDDIFPTFLEMAGITPPANDGESWVQILKENSAPPKKPRELLWHYPNFYNQPPYSSLRIADWKLIYWHRDQSMELFNLSSDISEKTNLADKNPERLREMATRLTWQLKDKEAQFSRIKKTGKSVPYPIDLIVSNKDK